MMDKILRNIDEAVKSGLAKAKEFPLYPPLSEPGAEEAQVLMDTFKAAMVKAAENVLHKMYSDVATHIESDSWTNFRNDVMDGFRDYKNKIHAEYDFKEIRQQILKHHREEIIADLNQDLVEEVEDLKDQINQMRMF